VDRHQYRLTVPHGGTLLGMDNATSAPTYDGVPSPDLGRVIDKLKARFAQAVNEAVHVEAVAEALLADKARLMAENAQLLATVEQLRKDAEA
jgi:hypothetical protein